MKRQKGYIKEDSIKLSKSDMELLHKDGEIKKDGHIIQFNEDLLEAVISGNKSETLVIFDLDDTLVITDAKIKLVDPKTSKIVKSLTPEQFNDFKDKGKYIMNFEDFESPEILQRGKIIHSIFRQLKKFYKRGIPIAIVTARSSSELVSNFFLTKGIPIHKDLVIAVNDTQYGFKGTIEDRKKEAILGLIDRGFSYIVFYDDSEKNLRAVKKIERERKVKIITTKV